MRTKDIANRRLPRTQLIYCPYTDRVLHEDDTNSEHIIPLSLGGVNDFVISVDASFNSKVGSDLDGALANEFIWALARTKYDTRGHSGKEPRATIKRATYGDDDRVAQVHFGNKGISVWDVRDREFKKVPGTFKISTSLNVDMPIRFSAKVALAAGYYVYRDLFREAVDHRQLRDVMRINLSKLDLNKKPENLGLGHLTLTADSYLHGLAAEDDLQIIRLFCSAVRGSVVILMPGPEFLSVAVGILGRYLAMVTVPADTNAFPNSGKLNGGHIMVLSDKRLYRTSVADGLSQFVEADHHFKESLPLTPLRELPKEVVTSLTTIGDRE